MSEPPQRDGPGGGGVRTYFEIRFVCTGRCSHHRRVLVDLVVDPGGELIDVIAEETSFRPADRHGVLGPSAYDEFRCPKCRRNPRIGHEKFVELLRQLCERGVGVCDISLLPF